MLFKTWQRGSLKICIHGNNGHYIFKLSAHESVKVPAEVFFCNQVPYSGLRCSQIQYGGPGAIPPFSR